MTIKQCELAGIPVSAFEDIPEVISHIFNGDSMLPGYFVAVNPEKIMASFRDQKLKDFIVNSTIAYPDGIGAVLAMRKKGVHSNRIPGCELWEAVIEKLKISGNSVYILGGSEEVNNIVSDNFREEGINLVGSRHGYYSDEQNVIDDLIALKPDFITVALGSPKQELFINRCLQSLPKSTFMGVGGTLDVVTRKVERAPLLFRKHGFEWLYRLLSNPNRIFRQISLLYFIFYMMTGRV